MGNETFIASKEKKSASLFWLLVLIGLVLAVQLGMWAWMSAYIETEEKRAFFGDMFGGVNTLFSGMAFAGIIYTILLQRNELALQREELSETRKELKRSADAHMKNAAIMDLQLDTLSKTFEIQESQYRETILPALIGCECVESQELSDGMHAFSQTILNKGRAIKKISFSRIDENPNFEIEFPQLSYFGPEQELALSYKCKPFCEKYDSHMIKCEINFYTLDEKYWSCLFVIGAVKESGGVIVFFTIFNVPDPNEDIKKKHLEYVNRRQQTPDPNQGGRTH